MTGGWKTHIVAVTRWWLGLDYLINGINWFHKIITPYPSMSDFVAYLPPHDIVGALIENGVLFPAAKAIELIAGLALLADFLVPLALVLAMSVTVPVFVVDVLNPHPHLRALLMGTGALTMNLFLLSAYFAHYRLLFTSHGIANLDTKGALSVEETGFAGTLASIIRPCMVPWACISALLGMAMVIWLIVMILQYVMNPLPLSAIHSLTPRVR